jgi:L1 cell adhesion molecule like protein
MEERTLIGISFGTVYSCVSIPGKVFFFNETGPEAIANEDGDRQIPSYVAFTGYEELCGTQAKLQALANPRGTVSHFRALLGHKVGHTLVAHHQSHFRVPITGKTGDEDTPVYEVEEHVDGQENPVVKQYSVVDVTAKYLKKLKETAEYYLSKQVDGVVISIPAHFEESQKKELMTAAHLAGFKGSYAVHEPVAAALAFNASPQTESSKQDKQIVVLDLGAESFNISVISNHDGLYTIEESVEEPNLGGLAFDKVLLEYGIDDFKRKTKMDVSDSKRALVKLQNACERAKKSLTRQDTAPLFVESLYEGIDYNGTIIRGRFEMMAEPLFLRCKEAVLKTLKKCHAEPKDIDQVLLVGGSSRIPRFQQVMKGLFPEGIEFRTEVEPDEAISLGCAVQARILLENNLDLDVEYDEPVVNAEHVSKTVGIKDANGNVVPIIPVGTPLPVRRAFRIPTKSDSVFLQIVEQGDQVSALGEVALTQLPRKDNVFVDVVFWIENDGLLKVEMAEKQSGEKLSVTLK